MASKNRKLPSKSSGRSSARPTTHASARARRPLKTAALGAERGNAKRVGAAEARARADFRPELSGPALSWLRGQAHHLNPVVQVGASGVTAEVLTEVKSKLARHELIKVKIGKNADGELGLIAATLALEARAALVQRIGRVVVLYRPAEDAADRVVVIPRDRLRDGDVLTVEAATKKKAPVKKVEEEEVEPAGDGDEDEDDLDDEDADDEFSELDDFDDDLDEDDDEDDDDEDEDDEDDDDLDDEDDDDLDDEDDDEDDEDEDDDLDDDDDEDDDDDDEDDDEEEDDDEDE
jgi:putative YhbY family RNA-binding protein